MKQKQYLYKHVRVTSVEPLGHNELAMELGLLGYRAVFLVPGDVTSSLIFEFENEIEVVPTVPEGQVAKPTRTLWITRKDSNLYYFEKWRGIYDYEDPKLPCLDMARKVTFELDNVRAKWQHEMSLAAKFLMSKHEGIKDGEEFQFWLPGLTDDEELLK